MGAHAFLAPSSAHIWAPPKGCRAYPLIAASFPRTNDCDESDEGTAGHELAGEAVSCAARAMPVPDRSGQQASNGVFFDPDMHDAAEIYARYIQGIMRETRNFNPRVEQWVAVPSVHENNAGTPDTFLWSPEFMRLDVFDYKYGFLIVEAFENWQLMNYALGVLDNLGIDGQADQKISVHLHVCQPRAPHREGPWRSWSLLASDLRGYRNIFRTSAAECFEPNPVARTGPHCRYCEGRAVCPALRADAAAAADYSNRSGAEPINPADLAVELTILDDALERLKYRHDALTEQVEHSLRKGEYAPGWGLEPKQSRLKWVVSDTEVYALGDALDIELRKTKPATPTQAKALGVDADIIDGVYAVRPNAGLGLVRDTGVKTRKIFGGLKNG